MKTLVNLILSLILLILLAYVGMFIWAALPLFGVT